MLLLCIVFGQGVWTSFVWFVYPFSLVLLNVLHVLHVVYFFTDVAVAGRRDLNGTVLAR